MVIKKSITSSVYVVYKNKVLLHKHKKYNTLFPLGGKMNANEVPHEAAIREVLRNQDFRLSSIIEMMN